MHVVSFCKSYVSYFEELMALTDVNPEQIQQRQQSRKRQIKQQMLPNIVYQIANQPLHTFPFNR